LAQSIEICTAQNVTIEYELATLRERAMGYCLDILILLVVYIMLISVISATVGSEWLGSMGWTQIVATFPFISFFTYNVLFEIARQGQTPGKKAMGIRVVRLDGKEPEWSDVLLRTLLHLADSIFCMGVIGALLIKTTSRHQRLGDMAANTTVIKLYNLKYNFQLADILKISSSDNYEPVFSQVRSLSEQDMIFIKTVLDRRKAYNNQAHNEVVEDLVTHLMPILQIKTRPADRVEFLKTLLRDYIVLTR